MNNNIISFQPSQASNISKFNKVSAQKNIVDVSLNNSVLTYNSNNTQAYDDVIDLELMESNIKEYTLEELLEEGENAKVKVRDRKSTTGNFSDFTDWQNVKIQYIYQLSFYKDSLNKYLRKYDKNGNVVSDKNWTFEDIYKDLDPNSELAKTIKRYIDNGFGQLTLVNIRHDTDGYDSIVLQDPSGNYLITYPPTDTNQSNDLLYDAYPILRRIGLESFLEDQTTKFSVRDLRSMLNDFGMTGLDDYLSTIELSGLESFGLNSMGLGTLVEKINDEGENVYLNYQKKALEDYKFYAEQTYKEDLKDGKIDNDVKVNLNGYSQGGDLATYVYNEISNPPTYFQDLLNIVSGDFKLGNFLEHGYKEENKTYYDWKQSLINLALSFGFGPLLKPYGYTYSKFPDNKIPFTAEHQQLVDRLGTINLYNPYTATISHSDAKKLADDPNLKYYVAEGDGVSALFNYDAFRESDNFKIIYGGNEKGESWYSTYEIKEVQLESQINGKTEIMLEWVMGNSCPDDLFEVIKAINNISNVFTVSHAISGASELGFDVETGEVLEEVILETGAASVTNVSSEEIFEHLIGGGNPVDTADEMLEYLGEETVERIDIALETKDKLEDDGAIAALWYLVQNGEYQLAWNLAFK